MKVTFKLGAHTGAVFALIEDCQFPAHLDSLSVTDLLLYHLLEEQKTQTALLRDIANSTRKTAEGIR